MVSLNRWIILPKVHKYGKLFQQITLASNWYELKTNSDCLEFVKVRLVRCLVK